MSDRNRTAFAIQALGLAESFNVMLAGERVKGAVTYRVELSAPDGPSTAGGKQATQYVKLVPDDSDGGGGTIVAGSANQAESWAELRSFEHLKRLHAQRFHGADIPLNRVQYNELVDKLRAFFVDKGCAVRMAPLPDAPTSNAPGDRGASGTLVMIVIVVAAALAATGVVWFFTHR